MPPKKIPNRSQRSESDESDEEEAPKSSQNKSQYLKISADVREQLVSDCVYYILIANQKGYPIKKIDIAKHVLKDHPRSFPFVIQKAKEILSNVFAINFIEVPNKKGHYLLINKFNFSSFEEEDDANLPQFWSDKDCAHYGLLMLILSIIFMSGNLIPETMMWQFLKKLGLDVESDQPHPIFGNIKKLVNNEFVRKLYLEHNLIQGSDPPMYEFRCGPRARLETHKMDMITVMSNMYGNIPPEAWTAQYQDAMQDEPIPGTSKQ